MKVSIIIPVYNVSDYIGRCIKSVISQTYGNIECIIVDDASPDDSILQCKKLIEGDKISNAVFLHHDMNRGLSAARNTGTEAATGDYIYYLDSDDEITTDCIEKLMAIAHAHPDADMIVGNHKRIEDGRVTEFFNEDSLSEYDTNEAIMLSFKRHGLPGYAWNKMVKRSFIREHHISFIEGLVWEDIPWTFEVNKYLNRLYVCKQVTYYHHIRPNSIVTSTDAYTIGRSWSIIIKGILHNLTTGRESKELSFYSDSFCKHYVVNKDEITEYKSLMKEYKSLALEYWSIVLLLKLHFTCLVGRAPFGLDVLNCLQTLKYRIMKVEKRN